MRLDDKSAIVTGGGKGIGKVFARRLAQEGASVTVADIDEAAAESTAQSLRDSGHQAKAVYVDVSKPAEVETLTEQAVDAFGTVDVLVNNAAVFSSIAHRPFWEIDEADWDRVMEVNAKGMFLCARSVVPHMKKQSYGKIINITSATIFKGTPNLMHYVCSKAAVRALTRCLSQELGEFGIRVNAIAPGLTESDTTLQAGTTPEHLFDEIPKQRALQQPETPADLTGALVFLASEESDFITGQTLVVDGGSAMN